MAKAGHTHAKRKAGPAPDTEALRRAAALFRAVGDEARLRLLYELGGGEQCVTELAEHSGTKLSTLSQQLRVLYAERIVERRREGKHIYYRLADDHVEQLMKAALAHAHHHDH